MSIHSGRISLAGTVPDLWKLKEATRRINDSGQCSVASRSIFFPFNYEKMTDQSDL